MQVVHHFFPQIIDDNDEVFLSSIKAIVESVDEYAALEISKFPTSLNFRIVPSHPKYNNMLIQEIIKFHNMFNIFLDMGKSIKASATISFKINL